MNDKEIIAAIARCSNNAEIARLLRDRQNKLLATYQNNQVGLPPKEIVLPLCKSLQSDITDAEINIIDNLILENFKYAKSWLMVEVKRELTRESILLMQTIDRV